MQFDPNPPDLLADEFYFERASHGKRLANYIIDMMVFYLLVFITGVVIALAAPNTFESISAGGLSSGVDIVDRLIALFIYGVYMSIVEAVLRGKSVGKLITKTRAVNFDGSRISVGTAISRGLSRALPFCVFSAFGEICNPWQDRWTDTMVINDPK